MHTSFTGSARKARQVNLSGRSAANPWANLSGISRSPQSTGTQSTLANAQADRVRRQQGRDKIVSAKKIQNTWRGYRSRTAQKQKWREEWDQIERQRLKDPDEMQDDGTSYLSYSGKAYATSQLCLGQMRLLVHFLDFRDIKDDIRLLSFGSSLKASISNAGHADLDDFWTKTLRSLTHLVARRILIMSNDKMTGNEILRVIQLGIYITTLIPDEVAVDAGLLFRALSRLLGVDAQQDETVTAISLYAIAILSGSPKNETKAYSAFVNEMFGEPNVGALTQLFRYLRGSKQQILLSNALSESLQPEYNQSITSARSSEQYSWQLAYLIQLREFINEDSISFPAWIQATSTLLSRCANEIAVSIDDVDQPMEGIHRSTPEQLNQFQTRQILSLAERSSVELIVKQLSKSTGSNTHSVSSMAKPLANYAVALLRAFPTKAINIRMWLYRGSPSSESGSLSTIQYLWQATRTTGVFNRITNDQRSVMSVLTEAAPEHHQLGRAPTSPTEIATWQEDWRIVLLFLELYTFILKIMDDEEFFALNDGALQSNRMSRSQFSQGALPLSDISVLTKFLKNLAFSLYWNAADLAETNEIEEMGGLSALFGTTPVEVRQVEKKKLQTLAGNGVSQLYLKERVTGLLRMLHERDSRRKFLPDGHWLMTSHVDMQGFITSVVAEEEKRHEIDEEEEELQDGDLGQIDENEDTTESLQQFSSMFGIRPPHMARPQTSRYNDLLHKRRERAKKRRQAESLVPRLEILRNLPFFIPFETRVQIFREFIYRDQVRRRNGWVDADDWRMSVAHGTQGRGLDGRPSGMERVSRHHASIRRESVFEDAFDKFYDLGEELKEPIQISFIDRFGSQEAGIDGGGVTKEFLMSVTGEAFDPNQDEPMFVENDQRYLYPNPKIFELNCEVLRRESFKPGSEPYNQHLRELLRRYEFIGRIIGKCMYEGILVDINFAGFFLLKWALTGGTTSATTETAYRASINDLKDYDEALYQGLLKLKNYTGDVETDFSSFFEVSDEIKMPDGTNHTWTKELMHNGSNTAVTGGNRLSYIDKITRYRLQQQPMHVTNAFLKGLGQIIQPMWLAMFNQRELQKLVGGDNAELDINDLRRNTQYGGLYVVGHDGLEHPTVALFWKVLKEMNDSDRRKVLKFVTSTPRAPLLGFSNLNPKFSIRDSSEDQTRLPSTSTCVNLLKLPRYGDEETMREKLLYAVNSGAGFDLS